MSENFRVSFSRIIVVAVLDQLLLERVIIFDHAIVDESDLAARIEMGMRIFVVHLAMRGPAGVADAIGARGRLLRHEFGEISDAPRTFARLDLVVADNGDTGGIVAAIFKPAEPIEKNGRRFRPTDVPTIPHIVKEKAEPNACPNF